MTFILALPQSRSEVPRSFQPDNLQPYQLTNLTLAGEVALGKAVDAQLRQDGLELYSGDPGIAAYVNTVGQRVAAASRLPARVFTFQIVDDPDANARATMGGFIYINTGLLRAIQNEAELAGVLAHEVGHLEHRDGLNQLWHLLTVEQLWQQEQGVAQRLVEVGGQLRSLSNSHAAEFLADATAFRLLGEAGYAQVGLVTLLQRLQADSPGPIAPGLVSSHPPPQGRLRQLQRQLATVATMGADWGLDQAAYAARIANLDDPLLSPI
ncbi:MAG: M48 family metalloprotease [Cyanobacteria bacterium J06638_6]